MRFQIILALGLVAFASGSPLVDKKSSSLKVIDIPTDLFAEASENVEDVKKPIEAAESASVAPAADASEAKTVPAEATETTKHGDKKDETFVTPGSVDDKIKGDSGETENIDRPSIFGFRLPTIVVVRRPSVFDDPFSFFPFSSFNRRPILSEPAPPRSGSGPGPIETRDGIPPPPAAAAAPPEAGLGPRPVNGAAFTDIMHNMRQQMDSIFSSLFAPNPGFYPNRQFFPRPFFPPIPVDSSEDDSIDFDKLPNDYKNSTSTTKVVDGRVVEVNRTVQKIGGNNSNGFFQISVIKIRPSDTPVEQKPDVIVPPASIEGTVNEKGPDSVPSDVTTVKAEQEVEMNNPSLNEVDQEDKKETETVMTKTKYETDPGLLEESSASAPVPLPLTQEVIYDFIPLKKSMPLIEATKGKGKPLDLSSDLRVNNLMANDQSGRLRSLVDPDEIEVIEV